MRIDQVTKWRCNGCDKEELNPIGWISFSRLGNGLYTVGTNAISEDYCFGCVEKMRAAVKRQGLTQQTLQQAPLTS